uniref:Putative endonuclease n=1 Tax=viral metagenome TaxID=1070528 RepID=A0A6M3LWX6_9ZZZZ
MYYSTSCLSDRYGLSQILDIYDKCGIKNVELGVCNEPDIDLNILKNYDFNYIVHHYFPPPKYPFIINLASQNEQIRDKSVFQIIKSIDFCTDFGINLFSFHAGFRIDPDLNFKFIPENIPDYETSFNTFKESVLQIVDHAERCGVKVAIENNVIQEHNLVDGENKLLLMCELWEFKRLFDEIRSDNLGILLDLGHLKINSNILNFDREEFIESFHNKTFAVHLHENNGRVDQHRCVKFSDWSFDMVDKYFYNDVPCILECQYGIPARVKYPIS